MFSKYSFNPLIYAVSKFWLLCTTTGSVTVLQQLTYSLLLSAPFFHLVV